MSDTDDYADEWKQLDQKVILAQILTELQQIRMALTDPSDDAEGEPGYRCQRCNETVPADARERHARESHKAPPEMAEGMFERVE